MKREVAIKVNEAIYEAMAIGLNTGLRALFSSQVLYEVLWELLSAEGGYTAHGLGVLTDHVGLDGQPNASVYRALKKLRRIGLVEVKGVESAPFKKKNIWRAIQ